MMSSISVFLMMPLLLRRRRSPCSYTSSATRHVSTLKAFARCRQMRTCCRCSNVLVSILIWRWMSIRQVWVRLVVTHLFSYFVSSLPVDLQTVQSIGLRCSEARVECQDLRSWASCFARGKNWPNWSMLQCIWFNFLFNFSQRPLVSSMQTNIFS